MTPDLRVAHRTSPTNIAMGLLATVSAHDLGFIDIDDMVARLDATLTTVEGLDRFEGHLLNWYDTETLAPLQPRLRLDRRQRQPRRRARHPGGRAAAAGVRGPRLGATGRRGCAISRARAGALFDAMDFRLLYDARRQLFAVGYRLADAETRRAVSMRRATTCWRPKRAWRASWRSPRATCPNRTGSISAASVTAVHGAPVLLSWSAHAVRVPDAAAADAHLSRHAARRVLPDGRPAPDRLRREARRARGASPSRPTTPSIGTAPISTKPSACPGSGLKRGLGDELVVAPYATRARGDARAGAERERT